MHTNIKCESRHNQNVLYSSEHWTWPCYQEMYYSLRFEWCFFKKANSVFIFSSSALIDGVVRLLLLSISFTMWKLLDAIEMEKKIQCRRLKMNIITTAST